MGCSWLLLLLSLGLTLNTDRCAGAAQQCNAPEWFGLPCRYKCNCASNQCDNTGECTGGSTCKNGWFGPACQYVDLVANNSISSTPAWVHDNPDRQCNPGKETVTISLDDTYYFTWLRLRASVTVSPGDFVVKLMAANGIAVECSNMYTSAVSDTLLDIHCQPGAFFEKLNITGAGIKNLCSVMVSGGRNVALGQNATQTSIYSDTFPPWIAVDGNRDSDFLKLSCSHTRENDTRPTWTLALERPHQVNIYVLYNRKEVQDRLQGFNMEAYREDGSVAFNYTDHTTTNQDIYIIPSTTPWIPVSSVNITATNKGADGYIILTLCEVEMFGDTVCPAGRYGRDCDKECNCAKSGDSCFISTGGCPSGCAAGYRWEECQTPCDQTHFGVDCLHNCSTNCAKQHCQPNNGTCLSCISGKQGPLCDSDCKPTFWGENCAKTCWPGCKKELCDAVTGKCFSCVAGRSGENCDQACNATHHGENCALPCSSNCTDQHCNATNGHCQSCLIGKSGIFCDEACPPRTYGQDCKEKCNTNCNVCEAVNGKCASCVPGWTGDFCNEACNATFYGVNCALPCSSGCTDHLCNATTGHCLSCLIGKYGIFCDEECPPGTYGQDCKEKCNSTCSACDAVNGTCTSCVPGWTGDFCDEALSVQAPGPGTDESPNVAVIVGPVVAFVVLVALIVVGVLIWRRRRHKNNVPDQTNPHSLQIYEEIDSVRTVEPNAVTHKTNNVVVGQAKPPTVMKKPTSSQGHKDLGKEGQVNHVGGDYYNHLAGRSETAIKFDDLDNFMAAHRKEFYQEQFNRIPANNSATTTVGQSAENQSKNRYKNISAYDHSRVHLQTDVLKNHGDYINASYIDGYKHKKQFIASQGPTKIILGDFVRMLWEQQVQVVVMLTNLVEDGKLKCEQYWPDDGEINIGEITVKLITTQVFADYTVRSLCLYKTPQHIQILTHFHFTTWSDKDVTAIAWRLVDLEQRLASIATSKPIVVHCSAGVGRTGTFIALHNILEEIKHTGYLDVFTTVQKIRLDRINMVQTFQQYELLHRATQIAMLCRDTTETLSNLRDTVQLLERKSESGQSNLEKEFKSLCLVCGEDDYNEEEEEVLENNTYYNSRLLSNRMKNRLHNVLPKEFNRPILRCETGDLGHYINAVLVPSSKKHDHHILTQLPLPTTVVDFWRLVTQYNVSLIVAFERDLSTEDMKIGDYLPEDEGETKTWSFLNITTTGLNSGDAWEVHTITITTNEETVSNVSFKGEINLSHLTWKNKDLDSTNLLTLMETVRAMKPTGERRTLFTCRNGAEWSGLAYTLSLLLDRMDNDQHVSVPLVVGTVKAIRPQIVPTLDQYRLLYQVLNLFKEANNEYSNVINT